jgi:hypothetical protein
MSEAVDYLGHPCDLTRARGQFAGPLEEARVLAEREPREIARQLGRQLLDLNERLSCQHEVANALLRCDLEDEARAIVTMASPYSCETSNRLYQLAGLALFALEQLGGNASPRVSDAS